MSRQKKANGMTEAETDFLTMSDGDTVMQRRWVRACQMVKGRLHQEGDIRTLKEREQAIYR